MQAALGRTFTAADADQAAPVTVLSHDAWMELTGGDPSAVGRTLTFAQATVEVVGVMPPSFDEVDRRSFRLSFPSRRRAFDEPRLRTMPASSLRSAGSPPESRTQAAALERPHSADGRREADERRDTNDLRYAFVGLLDELVAGVRVVLSGLFTVSLLVLLIACSTAASLVAIRFGQRGAELGLHRALGASDAAHRRRSRARARLARGRRLLRVECSSRTQCLRHCGRLRPTHCRAPKRSPSTQRRSGLRRRPPPPPCF